MRTVPLGPAGSAASTGNGAVHDDPDHANELIGRILSGRYEVRAILGRGGMGIVYEGRHITIGRRVAIKVLRRDLARSTQAVARFQREAQAAALIGSPHIVEVLDYGYAEEGQAFLVMELLEGDDLGRLIRREGALPEVRAAAIARQVAKALAGAHSKGIIHRDLKSENVFIVERDGVDFVKLLDFGISKITEGDDSHGPMTLEGVVMGTPHYMAPEQAVSALEADHRIDLYALGCLLYEMLVGRVPFGGRNPVEVVFKHVHEAPVPPSKARPDRAISPAIEAVVMKLLAKDRDQRYATAADVVAALPSSGSRMSLVDATDAALSSTMELPRIVSSPPVVVVSKGRRLAGGAVGIASAAAVTAFLMAHHHAPTPNRPSRSVAATDGGLIALTHAAPNTGVPVMVTVDAAPPPARELKLHVVPSDATATVLGQVRHGGAVEFRLDPSRHDYDVVITAPGCDRWERTVDFGDALKMDLRTVALNCPRLVANHVHGDAGGGGDAAEAPSPIRVVGNSTAGNGSPGQIEDMHPSPYQSLGDAAHR